MVPKVTVFQVLLLLILISIVAATTVLVTYSTQSGLENSDFKTKVTAISGVNGLLVALLGFISFMYIRADPLQERSYLVIMLHINLFLSLLAVSISTLQKVG